MYNDCFDICIRNALTLCLCMIKSASYGKSDKTSFLYSAT
ncbi:hypothetical protein PROSTU_02010 [Providencia stuartii ATCC 25827]|uniref:Uncharacterized protein n=1 Tax=Providencia stuartii ATCC 25827 TaxID=471874 RepID=A0AA87CQ99_PROST|nr:hypothetical protein PROSTU_02010 [Providencia stuartii ATCC 25827]